MIIDVRRALIHWLVDIQIAFMNFQVKTTARVRANPGFKCHGRPLGSIVGKWNKLAITTLSTFRPCCNYHQSISYFCKLHGVECIYFVVDRYIQWPAHKWFVVVRVLLAYVYIVT